MSGSVRLDAKFPTIEQEAPLVSNPSRAVEIFTQDDRVYLRIGPVEGVNPAHGSYTLMLTSDGAREIAEALQHAGVTLASSRASAPAETPSLLRPHANTW